MILPKLPAGWAWRAPEGRPTRPVACLFNPEWGCFVSVERDSVIAGGAAPVAIIRAVIEANATISYPEMRRQDYSLTGTRS